MKKRSMLDKRLEGILWIPETIETLSPPKKRKLNRAKLEKAAREFREFYKEVLADEARASQNSHRFASHS